MKGLAAERPRLALALALIASGLGDVVAAHLLRFEGGTLARLPLSLSAGAVTGWSVALLCLVGTAACLDTRGILLRRVKSVAAEVDARIAVSPNEFGFWSKSSRLNAAYEHWAAKTSLRRSLNVLVCVLLALGHMKMLKMPQCWSLRIRAARWAITLLALGATLSKGRRVGSTASCRSLLGLASFNLYWASHIGFLAVGDRCIGSFAHAMFSTSTASACAMSCLMLCVNWLICRVSPPYEKYKAVSGWAGCAASSYLHMLYQDSALRPAVDEDRRALLCMLLSVSAMTLVLFSVGTRLTAARFWQFLQLLRTNAVAREELLTSDRRADDGLCM